MLNGLCEGTLYRPTTMKPPIKGNAANPENFGPPSDSVGFTLKGEPVIILSVSTLLHLGGPAAIAGLIVAIIIDTVQCHTFWSFAHIRKKVLKFIPANAESNTTAPIARIAYIIGVQNSLVHRVPSFVGAAACHSMSCIAVVHQASTGTRRAASQVGAAYNFFYSAITPTQPHSLAVPIVFSPLQYQEPVKPLPRQVNEWRHRLTSMIKGLLQVPIVATQRVQKALRIHYSQFPVVSQMQV